MNELQNCLTEVKENDLRPSISNCQWSFLHTHLISEDGANLLARSTPFCRTVFGEHPARRYPIPAPSLSEQKVIVAKLNELTEQTQRLVRIEERKLAALEALKNSLLHQAFTGLL